MGNSSRLPWRPPAGAAATSARSGENASYPYLRCDMKDYSQLLNGHPELQRKSIIGLGEAGITEAIPFLKDLLRTQNSRLRDAAALSLSEMGVQEAVPAIMDLILHPDNEGNRGSLIFSLWKLECIDYFQEFVNIVCYGNYESRHNALELVQQYRYRISPDVRRSALATLQGKRVLAETEDDAEREVAFLEYVEALLMDFE
ncbi:HEAT repeat domain-containing protein [Chitinophaga horti]|uniref:HEAT repeat domain-containing protein n=1 Tax=Chitinophaga horti TaxID=2920382 RepID=A0ABY6IUN1_9BACT|nr:HEAT repeat domain-containing protein [Chitinophaga horti]UYQ91071.1 HEAT repeat domain-containing protein [Chitinophaga horti]